MVSAILSPGSSVELADFPIPRDRILEGNPKARIWINAQSADKKVTQGVWDCTAGRFSWDYAWDEFVMILDGEVTVTPEDGEPFTLSAGDFCHFPVGLKAVWRIDRYIKKTFSLRTPEPLEL